MHTPRVAIIGAGIGGLAAAVDLAARGVDVTVIERAATPGGKMREIGIDGARIDAGPTVFTMRWVFDEVFARAGTSLDAHLTLVRANILARHAWGGDARLDLFADIGRSADAVGDFAGAAEAARFLAFCEQCRHIYNTLENSFIRGARPTPLSLVRSSGLRGIGDLWRIKPFDTMWAALSASFRDPKLRQLFGRYATYCGSSPFLAPATLMLVAHVEREGVWLVQGGMFRVAAALEGVARSLGASFRYGEAVHDILVSGGRAGGVRLASGETFAADAVVLNADPASLAAGLFGGAGMSAIPAPPVTERSLSAVTWAMHAETDGFPLVRHNVFFSPDYEAEFAALQIGHVPPRNPTIYVCAQDRGDDPVVQTGPERLLCLVNAPPLGDSKPLSEAEIETCTQNTFGRLEELGLRVRRSAAASVVTAPQNFASMFPATGGALYGPAVHGAMATFRRPGSRTKLPGLYLAGGSAHPGAGVPMAALSGHQAASSVLQDFGSTRKFHSAAMPGGISTR